MQLVHFIYNTSGIKNSTSTLAVVRYYEKDFEQSLYRSVSFLGCT